MARTGIRLATTGAAVVLAVTGVGGVAVADTTATAPTGSAVITVDGAFLAKSVLKGIVVVPLTPATAAAANNAITATFPVTGGAANIPSFSGDVQFGGSLLFFNATNGKSVVFKQLDFGVRSWKITAVPDGGTNPVALLDPLGDTQVGRTGTTQSLTASSLQVDAEGAQYLDKALGTTYFTGGQSVGSLALSFTPGS
ncbi:hypothetical protein ACFV84_15645 [Kitasatospora sp. NPDC059811]|uniref:hypothetical protein n=1 Tax=Streptomycetaceae TaxID=2062 RepID=UPI0007AFBB16|nr:hypothetical protein [Streptomyces sp. MJM8645]